ncbi:RadC family protein [Cyclobacterium sp. SYSU L10401]|uniref:JAB domain-containing protein n=1 Tax=Cyclobacterium sp. SYSU L10401 TaxID=2678657 RepID=UPI0013D4CE50|nr:JAB domain-containing protein [Cyclobacterium sp. SYSU L10401]
MTQIDLFKISEVELVYRQRVRASERPKVTSSTEAYRLFRQNWDDCTINLLEEFKILLLDRSNKCMGLSNISKGGMSATVVDPKIVFTTALKAKACGLILGHNHPSENCVPSDLDVRLTDKMVRAGKLLDISVLDHIIVTNEGYYSFADEGRLTL